MGQIETIEIPGHAAKSRWWATVPLKFAVGSPLSPEEYLAATRWTGPIGFLSIDRIALPSGTDDTVLEPCRSRFQSC